MKSAVKKTLDDILFENRNKEYGSYRLRKQYFLRLAISFLISLSVTILLVLGFSWYLNTGGDETIFLYPSTSPYLKTTQGSLLSPQELNSYLNSAASPEKQEVDQISKRHTDALHNFKITENATPDTFKPSIEIDSPADINTEVESSEDSVVFGGFLMGDGEGGGTGSNLDRFPEFPGGIAGVTRYLEMNVYYPAQAIKMKIHGVVLVSFDVNKLGAVDNIRIERSIHPMVDAEAIKAIKTMPQWKPGIRHGRPISVKFIVPVNFIPVS
jgi:TonB family protein